ncbi:MAG: zinc ribbon domain-containing protein [Vicinamibacterales bacterium]
MPIYEYICRTCDQHFETLVTTSRQPSCPSCRGRALDKQLSVFAVSAKSSSPAPVSSGACGSCGDPRGPGACNLN